MNALEKAIAELHDAYKSATLEKASFGWPAERIEVDKKSLAPDEYIKEKVKLYHTTWILAPIHRAITILESQQRLLKTLTEIEKTLPYWKLQQIAEDLKAGQE